MGGVGPGMKRGGGSHLSLAQALVLDGKLPEARKEYARLLTLWSPANPDLPPLKQARVEMTRLLAHP